jgi:hypothetical protein
MSITAHFLCLLCHPPNPTLTTPLLACLLRRALTRWVAGLRAHPGLILPDGVDLDLKPERGGLHPVLMRVFLLHIHNPGALAAVAAGGTAGAGGEGEALGYAMASAVKLLEGYRVAMLLRGMAVPPSLYQYYRVLVRRVFAKEVRQVGVLRQCWVIAMLHMSASARPHNPPCSSRGWCVMRDRRRRS